MGRSTTVFHIISCLFAQWFSHRQDTPEAALEAVSLHNILMLSGKRIQVETEIWWYIRDFKRDHISYSRPLLVSKYYTEKGMTQMFFKAFVSQLWRLNPITKLEEINLSLSCHLHWKDGWWQTISLFSGRVWTIVQKLSGLLLPHTSLGHQTLLCQGVTTVLIFSGNLHPLWWSGRNRGRESLQNKLTGGKSFQNVTVTYHMKMQRSDGQCLNLLLREAGGRAVLS